MSTEHPPRLTRVPFQRVIRVEGKGGVRTFQAINLSLGGMFLRADRPPFVGTRLTVALDTGGAALHLGEAEVVWRASGSTNDAQATPQWGFGLRFVHLEATARSLVETVVSHGGISTPPGFSASRSEEPTQPGVKPVLGPESKTDPFLN